MLSALESEGTATGVLADSLLRVAMSAKYRAGLMKKNLVLISPFNPEAGFDAGNAMARNRYIYCLADAGVVVTTSKESGGTWNGAIENLKRGWVPLWIMENAAPDSGNTALARQGARWLPAGDLVVSSLMSREPPDPGTAS
jgi:predicted Rossmann fold nucleotide-binding protein DprA/Smf involved in DNA uptake